jgi:hypothetical protein
VVSFGVPPARPGFLWVFLLVHSECPVLYSLIPCFSSIEFVPVESSSTFREGMYGRGACEGGEAIAKLGEGVCIEGMLLFQKRRFRRANNHATLFFFLLLFS